jgi:dTDP-4-amino-4,6-dideoxygalactose transaminase
VTDRVPLSLGTDEPLAPELAEALARVALRREWILGPEVLELEAALCEYLGVGHAIGVSSGTDALVCALCALDVGPGDEVVTTPFTFVATGEAILRVGATPVFADVEPDTLTLDPARVAMVAGARTRAVVPVHIFGHVADVDGLARLGLPVLEDAAQATGARRGGRCAGTLGIAGCLSFFPTKPLGGCGDGGMVLTGDASVADRVRRLRQHGGDKREFVELGGNYRLDALQAAFLRVKLPHLAGWLRRRHSIAGVYARELDDLSGLTLPQVAAEVEPAWAHYVVRVLGGRRDALARHLDDRGVATGVYYRRPLHLQPLFARLGYGRGSFPVAERAAEEVLALPLFPELSEDQQGRVIAAVRELFAGR